jgi:hypothetical protein
VPVARGGTNPIWILKNSKDLLQNNIVMGLVGGDNNIFVMEDKPVFSKHLGL